MYTSFIGKKFLKIYCEKYNKGHDYSASQFFADEMFSLFFESDKHLMHVGNSPFFQKPKEEDVVKHGSKALTQFFNFRKKINKGVPSGDIYVGFGAEEIQATSSGQLTSIDFKTSSEDMYASWIGEALGIGVNGGFVMLINEELILLALFNGWKQYRKYLQQTPNVKDKQIETWNGNWLNHSFQKDFDSNNPMDDFKVEFTEIEGKLGISTQKWSKIIFSLSKKYGSKTITSYCYNLSQTNTTLGFINIYLPEILRFYELRNKVFINEHENNLSSEEIEKLETFFNFKSACKSGTIGLKSLEPSKLREFMAKGSADYAQGKDYKFSDKNSYTIYSLYKLWIIAMLNKTELLKLASDCANALIQIEGNNDKSNRGKTDKAQESANIRGAKNLREFIENLTQILDKDNAETFKEVVDQVVKMPADNFPLFITLIRFEYSYKKNKN